MNSKTVVPVIVLLVIASFLVGTAWTKVTSKKEIAQIQPSPVAKQQAQASTQPQVLGASDMAELVKGGVVLGASDAKVTVVEFSDPSCPYCSIANGINVPESFLQRDPSWQAPGPELEKLAREGKIRLVFRYYPGHGTGEKAMQAAWCAAEQNQADFWKLLNIAFANQDKLNDLQFLGDQAGSLGLDKEKILACVGADKYKTRIQQDIQAGQQAAKIATGKEGFGTPSFFVNGKLVVGAQSFAVFKPIIDNQLNL